MTNEEAIRVFEVWIERDEKMEYADRLENIEIYKMAIEALKETERNPTITSWYDFDRGYEKGKANAQPHGEWILCSERVPKEHGYYIVQTDGSHNHVIDIAEYGRLWDKRCEDFGWGWNKASKVIAWMPLPEPYKKEG